MDDQENKPNEDFLILLYFSQIELVKVKEHHNADKNLI